MLKLSKKSNELLELSKMISFNLGHSYIGSEHLLLAFFAKNFTREIFISTLKDFENFLYSDILTSIVKIRGRGEETGRENKNFTSNLKTIIEKSYIFAFSQKMNEIEPEHLAITLQKEKDTTAYKVLLDISGKKCVSHKEVKLKTAAFDSTTTPVLNSYSKDLTQMALDDSLDPVIGREKEIERVMQILLRKNKNNPCLVGNPGVGKSAVVDALAIKIASGEVPEPLQNKRIVSLDISCVVAGAKYRGDFEERIKNIFDEIKKAGNVILFIDEVHNIVNTGAGEGSLDAANILKPELARGDVSIIGATTFDEYKKYIEKDSALERRFQKVFVEEPSCSDTIEIIRGIKERYEKFHKVKILDDAILTAVEAANSEMIGRFFPDKAIDLIDETSAMACITSKKVVDSETVLSVLKKLNEGRSLNAYRALRDSGIIKNEIKKNIFGQDNAVDSLVDAFMLTSANVGGCYLLCGPTGCGKTSLAKELSRAVFGDGFLLKLDMSEFSEKHSISKLIGSPPGYVGYEEGGILIDGVIKKPSQIILFDEIDKAHPDVLKILLSLLDDGVLRDRRGRLVSFKNVVIILTSSLGFENVCGVSGFLKNSKNVENEALMRFLGNEIYARIDEIITLEKPTIESAIIACQSFAKRKNIIVTDKVINLVLKNSDVAKLGLRNVKKCFEKNVERKVNMFLRNTPEFVGSVFVDVDEDEKMIITANFGKLHLEKVPSSMYNITEDIFERNSVDV